MGKTGGQNQYSNKCYVNQNCSVSNALQKKQPSRTQLSYKAVNCIFCQFVCISGHLQNKHGGQSIQTVIRHCSVSKAFQVSKMEKKMFPTFVITDRVINIFSNMWIFKKITKSNLNRISITMSSRNSFLCEYFLHCWQSTETRYFS